MSDDGPLYLGFDLSTQQLKGVFCWGNLAPPFPFQLSN